MAVRGGLQEEVTGADLWTVNRQSMKGGPQEGLVNAIRLAIQEVHRGSAGGRMEERGGWRQGGELGGDNQLGSKKNLCQALTHGSLRGLPSWEGYQKGCPGPTRGKVIFAQCPTETP